MEEVKVYHSLWKNAILVAVCFAFSVSGIYLLIRQPESNHIILWTGIIFFGLGGLFMLWLMLKERITHTPYYVITDKSVIMNSGMKVWEVRFADVEKFSLTSVAPSKMIGIHYNRDAEWAKEEDSGSVVRMVRKMNTKIAGVGEALPVGDLTIKPQQLCDLLNERLRDYRSKH